MCPPSPVSPHTHFLTPHAHYTHHHTRHLPTPKLTTTSPILTIHAYRFFNTYIPIVQYPQNRFSLYLLPLIPLLITLIFIPMQMLTTPHTHYHRTHFPSLSFSPHFLSLHHAMCSIPSHLCMAMHDHIIPISHTPMHILIEPPHINPFLSLSIFTPIFLTLIHHPHVHFPYRHAYGHPHPGTPIILDSFHLFSSPKPSPTNPNPHSPCMRNWTWKP